MLVHIATNGATSSLTEVDEDSIQPNAVDLRIDRVWSMHGTFLLDEDRKIHRSKTELVPDLEDYFTLSEGPYEISFKGLVSMGPDEAGYVITRSTLNRNGCFITSGLYDSGYGANGHGSMASCLHVSGGTARIKKGSRVGQFILWKAQSTGSYNGDYGKANGMDSYLR